MFTRKRFGANVNREVEEILQKSYLIAANPVKWKNGYVKEFNNRVLAGMRLSSENLIN